MSMEYNTAATTVADDYEEDGVFRATPIAIEMKKVGHSLFGCCCDTRRGTIIVGFITIAASIIALAAEGFGLYALAVLAAASNTTTTDENNNAMASSGGFGGGNDDPVSVMNQNTKDAERAIQNSMVFSLFSIVFACTTIYGAAVFKIWPVALNITFLMAHSLFYVVTAGAFFGFVIAALWMYPQIMFVVELHKGFMSSMTYSREAQSCCCINKRNK